MSLKSVLKKAAVATLLATTINCNSLFSNTETLEKRVRKPSKLKALAIPTNILAGYITTAVQHEGNHAFFGSVYDAQVIGLDIPYVSPEGTVYPCALKWDNWPEDAAKDTMIRLAGPLGQRFFIEGINYNLRNGNVSPEAQQFWATTSLVARATLFETLLGAFKGNTENDFSVISRDTGVSPETMLGILALDTALNARRIAKEFNVALGRDTYKSKPGKARFDIYPAYNGYFATYSRKF